MKLFMDEQFLLHTESARRLYHEHAASMPIFDFHCHVPPAQIAENTQFESITRVWLGGDHYKWRAMRTAGIDERRITGDADDWDKFSAWAETVPRTVGNPLYHWTHLELKRVFGIDAPLSPANAREIYDQCNAMLREDSFRVRSLISRFNVTALCTTDNPVDTLAHHRVLAEDREFDTAVLPAWRPDAAHALEHPDSWRTWIASLEEASGIRIDRFSSLLEALDVRHRFFHESGCRLSDHGLTTVPHCRLPAEGELDEIFSLALNGKEVSPQQIDAFRLVLLTELARMDSRRGWTMQLHLGALRSVNTRMFRQLGSDTGFDVIGDRPIAEGLCRFLDSLDRDRQLPKTVLYVLNPRDNELIASVTGAFQDGSIPGKVQFGSAWWFNDQLDGMRRQLTAVAGLGLISRFVGMLTDSRSFLSYPRHEYFRRLLCSMAGDWMEQGEVPPDYSLMGAMIQDICYNNAVNYFAIDFKTRSSV